MHGEAVFVHKKQHCLALAKLPAVRRGARALARAVRGVKKGEGGSAYD